MAKQWSNEEKAIMQLHYPTAPSVEDVAKMIGRPASVVYRKAISMGLSRVKHVDRLPDVLGAKLMTSGEVAVALDMTRNATNDLLRRAEAEGLCHIASYKSGGGRSKKDVAMWAAGKAGTLPSTRQKQARADRIRRIFEEANRLPARDPISIAWFGKPAQHFASADLSRRVYQHLLDDKEAA
ncbi:hypothetical protein [Paraburkholderia sp. RL18-085-BIA-A]|uniref:hypothetical protein n=1 Tax=Paraburkholderia sp. RL18-085-BIA-A TaxID=3031633 RepID=UPI0038BD5962